MDRWNGRVAVVTGASAGIGAAIVKDLVNAGMLVVGLARRADKVEALKSGLVGAKGTLHSYKCDVSSEEEVVATFAWIKTTFGGIDVLVNNAGIFKYNMLVDENNGDALRSVIDTNILGLCYCTREAVKSMKDRDVDGHIIHINSVAGHMVPKFIPPIFNIYSASKHAVTALTETLRQELTYMNSKVKVTSISPGAVATEILAAAGTPADKVKEILEKSEILKPEDISQAAIYVLGTPPHVQVHELTIQPLECGTNRSIYKLDSDIYESAKNTA